MVPIRQSTNDWKIEHLVFRLVCFPFPFLEIGGSSLLLVVVVVVDSFCLANTCNCIGKSNL